MQAEATKTAEEIAAEQDAKWVRVMAANALDMPYSEISERLIKAWCESLETARVRASESIGSIQVKPEANRRGQSYHRAYVDGKETPYSATSQDIAILLALGHKYLSHGEAGTFARFAGRMLGIEDGWTLSTKS